MTDKNSGPRSIALVGPYLSGKTSLMESLLFITGATNRKGRVSEGNTVGDGSAEAREREMGVELNVATTTYLDDELTFLDCPGSIEFLQETYNALIGADLAVVVCEPDVHRAVTLLPILKFLEDRRIPRLIFINKLDRFGGDIVPVVKALRAISGAPLVLRQIPILEGESASGYVDLASGRGYHFQENAASEGIEAPADLADTVEQARYEMLEKMADFDDSLMEKLLEDIDPDNEEVFADLSRLVGEGHIVPVMFGAGEPEYGVRRLLKALRHDAPGAGVAAQRLALEGGTTDPLAQVLKTYNLPNIGKLSLARVWQGKLADGVLLNGIRPSGLFAILGQQSTKCAEAEAGKIVALGRLEDIKTGDTLAAKKGVADLPRAETLPPVYTLAVTAANRNDEVKLSGAITKLVDEDPSLQVAQIQDVQELWFSGQGEIHLRVAVARLKNKFGIEVVTARPTVPYKEAIRKPVSQHGRHKRQTGGHGQFGDVHLDIKPLPRGSGTSFDNTIAGGVVPKQYIPAVQAGALEYLRKGPLGYPVVDVAVTLTDGSYHTVDSSELAFKTAAQIAMREGMPKCNPVLLEPILAVDINVPSEFTAKVNALVSGRRGQILGFEPREGWSGWDKVSAQIPQSEVQNLIVELRSLSLGVGSYTSAFDHLQELTGRLADQVLSADAAE